MQKEIPLRDGEGFSFLLNILIELSASFRSGCINLFVV